MSNSQLPVRMPTDQIGSSKPYLPPDQPRMNSSKPIDQPQMNSSKPYQLPPIKSAPPVLSAMEQAITQLQGFQKKLYNLTEKTGQQLMVSDIDKKALMASVTAMQIAVKTDIPEIINTLKPPQPTIGSSKSFFGSAGPDYVWVILIAIVVFMFFYFKKKKMF